MSASDGKVVISTELDNNGLRKGIQKIKGAFGGLTNVVKGLGVALAAVFGLRQIVSFMADSSKAAMALSDALTGLQSILEGQGRSFSQAQKFIEEYTADGLIPATNAITAYKNLASRGYDDTQIRQVMQALKDASAYGRQASYTMGEAVQSATEGLKNENSILVDNAGVTKNVAKMWEEYAASIGTTANNLTQQQKIQAEVTGILAEAKYQTGDAATVAGTLSGQLQQLSFNFNNLKVAIGNAVNPIVQSFLPILNAAISAVVRFANTIASVVGLLFGKASASAGALADANENVASSASAGAAAEKELASATTAAGKAAKKSLASFDELNKLQGNSGGSAPSVDTSGLVDAGATLPVDVELKDEDVPPQVRAIVDKIHELLAPLREIDFTPAKEAFARLGQAAEKLGRTIGSALEWAWFNILVPLAEWTVEEAFPAGVDLVSAALGLLNSVIVALQPAALWLWDHFLKPLAEWTGELFIGALEEVTGLLEKLSQLISGEISFGEFLGSLTGVQTAILAVVAAIGAVKTVTAGAAMFKAISGSFAGVKAFLGKIGQMFALATSGAHTLSGAITQVFGPGSVIAGIGAVIGGAVLTVTNFFSMLSGGFDWAKEALMLLGIAITSVGAIILGAPAVVTGVIAGIVAAVATAVVVIKENWATISGWFDEMIIRPVSGFFSGLWANISTWALDSWEDIQAFFAPAVEWFTSLTDSVGQTFSDIFHNIGVLASGCWEVVKAAWAVASGWFDQNVIVPVSSFFSNAWDNVKQGAADAWAGIKEAFSVAGTFFETTFSNAWQKVCEVFSPFGELFTDIKDGILTAFKEIVNGIIRGLNSAIAMPFNGINNALRKIRDIDILGLQPFSGLQTISVPQIPYLAKGAVLPANKPFLAMVGDQKHGTNVEAPLSTIQEAVALVMDNYAASNLAAQESIIALLQEILEAVLGIEIDGETLSRAVENYNRKMAVVRGGT